jgi:hypothetical protein
MIYPEKEQVKNFFQLIDYLCDFIKARPVQSAESARPKAWQGSVAWCIEGS